MGGKYYRYQLQHIDWGGNYWASVAVEFKKDNAAGHPKASKAIQNLRIDQQKVVSEQWTLTSVFPSVGSCAGSYVLALQSPKETTLWKSASILCNEPSNTFGGKIAAFFQGSTRLGGNMQVSFKMYDAADVAVTDTTKAIKYVYTINSMKRSAQPTFSAFQVIPVGTLSAKVTVVPPYNGGIPGSLPLAGSYVIKCPDPNGKVFKTRPQVFSRGAMEIQADFDEDISWLRGKVTIQDSIDGTLANNFLYNYKENGVNLFLTFDGLHSNPPQCTIESDTTSPLTGDTPTPVSETVRNYGTGLMFEPVGLEFLYSDATSPQVRIDIDGLPAVCPGLNCDYAYVQAAALITAQTYDSVSR